MEFQKYALYVNLAPKQHCLSFKAIHGQAIDRHLLGLRLQGIGDLTSMPEIFMDTSFAVAHHYNLLTSQVWSSRYSEESLVNIFESAKGVF